MSDNKENFREGDIKELLQMTNTLEREVSDMIFAKALKESCTVQELYWNGDDITKQMIRSSD